VSTAPATKLDPSRKYCSSCAAVIDAAAESCPQCGARLAQTRKSKIATALLAFFLGGIGAHRFYLGHWKRALLYVLFCWTFIPGLVALVEFIVFLVMSEERFAAKYGSAGGGGGTTVIVVAAVVVGGIVMMGVLAAIAVPNFVRYQLRAKSVEARLQLAALDAAEEAMRASGRGYVAVPAGLPSAPMSGAVKAELSPDDVALAQRIGWNPGSGTYGRYRVAVAKDDAGNEAVSMCAELDLDGDGKHAATVLFRPAVAPDGTVAVAPPPAPCTEQAAIVPGGSLEFQAGLAVGTPLPASPAGVF
jgi:TM2 domain-containing membrane protein YozV/type II secretory pathway pseudopilin PulG